jgi:UDP:flavonoid glycosyltransferase YjiC (YdhE family)
MVALALELLRRGHQVVLFTVPAGWPGCRWSW